MLPNSEEQRGDCSGDRFVYRVCNELGEVRLQVRGGDVSVFVFADEPVIITSIIAAADKWAASCCDCCCFRGGGDPSETRRRFFLPSETTKAVAGVGDVWSATTSE